MSQGNSPLTPGYRRMIRDDFLRLLFHPQRLSYLAASDRRLALDLDALGGLLGEW